MAFDFPASPLPGQIFTPVPGTSWKYNGSGWAQFFETNAVPEAPLDGQKYVRQSATWQVSDSAGLMTGAQILAALAPVDGVGSGLDADLLDGLSSTDFALNGHTHPADTSRVAKAGDTMTGKLNLPANIAGSAYLNLGSGGVAVTSPVVGDIYITATNMGVSLSGGTFFAAWTAGSQTFTGTKTFSVPPIMATPTTAIASMRLPHGVAPTTPTNGDLWTTTAGFYGRVNGVTVGPLTGATDISGKLDASAYTAADVLAKLVTVDGAGSGLDADLLDGLNSTAFSLASHTHADVIAAGAAGFMTGADKTKLDGVEAGSTADMTAAEILTSIKTVDGAGSLLDADLLDGNDSAYYATAAANALNVLKAGDTMTGDLTISKVTPVLNIAKSASGEEAALVLRTGANKRWQIYSSNTAESANAGSNFTISGYNDAGTLANTPVTITRSSGNITLSCTQVTNTGNFWCFGGTAIPAGGTTGAGFKFSSTNNFGTFFGSGVPTLSAVKGSHYYRNDGSSGSYTYVNINGTTGWDALADVTYVDTADALKAPIASPTFTGKVTTPATIAGSAGLVVPHGTAPTAPANGDFWSTSTGFYGRVNGVTIGPFGTAGSGGIADAPNDGSTYGRKNLGWVVMAGGGSVTEAPTDGGLYVRLNATWSNIAPTLAAKLDASAYTAADVLTKIKTVDGAASGLDADLLDGQSGAYYLDWANFTGTPSTFTPSAHNHPQSDITNLVTDLAARVLKAGDTMTGKLNTLVPTAGTAGLNLGPTTVSPTTPADGDIWITTSANMYARLGGASHVLANLSQVQTFTANKTFTGTTTQSNLWIGTVDGSSAGTGFTLMKRGSGFNEAIIFSDGVGGARGGIAMNASGNMTFRVGDNVTDDATISTTGVVTASQFIAGYLKSTVADGAQAMLLAGATKGIRFVPSATYFAIEGVDNTGVGSYQPLRLFGTSITLAATTNVSARLNTTASTTGEAKLNVPPGVAPTTPTDGDFWSTTAGFYGRVNGVTVGPLAGVTDISGKLDASAYTAADVLAKLITVDGAGSGLDADLLDGQSSAAFALAGHTHAYSSLTSIPSTFAPSAHVHPQSDVTNLVSDLALKAPLADPVFTGNPTAPTQALTDADLSIANTAYVNGRVTAPPLIPVVTSTDDASDWDTITGNGWYSKLLNGANAHGPSTGYFYVLGMSYGASRTQVAFPYSVGTGIAKGIYWRGLYTGTWTAWEKTATATEIADKYDKTGGDISGTVTLRGAVPLSIPGSGTTSPIIQLLKPAGTFYNGIFGYTVSSLRWAMYLGDSATEGGSDAGSDFRINRYSDTAVSLGIAFSIDRATGIVAMPSGATTATKTAGDSTGAVATTAFATAADNLRVLKAGDTMSGALAIGAFSATGASIGTTINPNASGWTSSANVTTTLNHLRFYNPNLQVGGITTNASATAYATSSDENLKELNAEYSPAEAIATILADPVLAFTWKATGEQAVGWFAQRSHAVDKNLAVPPPEPAEGESAAKPGDEGYQPWGIDYGRRTPYLWAAMTGLLDKIAVLEARLAVLEAG